VSRVCYLSRILDRRIAGNVHDRGPEKVLQSHEENAIEKPDKGYTTPQRQ